MYVTGSNPLSQDDVADFASSLEVHAGIMQQQKNMKDIFIDVLEVGPNIIIDDGGDLVTMVHRDATSDSNIIGGCEEQQ